ncbi:MAG: 50S ribosomal protein L21 [Spirochaetales bacterium]|nr:50S ribosomal protein L21 [Spirochaetales bacterium]
MYALVEIKGKQYKAEKGALLKVDKLDRETGESVEFDSVLLVSGEDVKVGTPYLSGVKVTATVEDQRRDKKVTIIKFRRRKNYRRKQGHRQTHTYIRVNEIAGA